MTSGSMWLQPVVLTTEQKRAIRQGLEGHLHEEQYSQLFEYIGTLLTRLPAYKPESTLAPGALREELERLAGQLSRAQKTLAYLESHDEGEGRLIDQEFTINTDRLTLYELSIQAAGGPSSGTAWMLDEIRKAVKARIEVVTPKKGEQSDHYDLIIIDLARYFQVHLPSIRPTASEGPLFHLVSYLFSTVLNVETRRQGGKTVEDPSRRIKRALKLLRQGSEQTKSE